MLRLSPLCMKTSPDEILAGFGGLTDPILPGDDSWKGEHLIRAPKRARVEEAETEPPPKARRGTRERSSQYGSGRIKCAVAGCNVMLLSTNLSTVCYDHKHRVGFCQCKSCRRRQELRAQAQ
jgi:hypothetical protein